MDNRDPLATTIGGRGNRKGERESMGEGVGGPDCEQDALMKQS